MITGARDNSDLTPEQREKFDVKEEQLEFDESDFGMEEEDLAFEVDDSTGAVINTDIDFSSDSTAGEEEEVKSMIDSTLLQQQIEELELELQNIRDIKELEKNNKKKGKKSETILLKIKIPNCRYLNDIYYVRGKFEFRYEYDFFLHYFDHRYFHRKKFYDRVDSTRIVAKEVMKLVGNSKYRHTDFNKIADSVATLIPNYPVVEYLDTVITQLNLEYLATGEIKIKFRNSRQKSIYSKLKPSKFGEKGSLGDIKFYTGNRRRVIEELDASQFDSLVIEDSLSIEENLLADSLQAIMKIKQGQDSIQAVQDSLEVLLESLSLSGAELDSVHNKLDMILWGGDADSTSSGDGESEEFDPMEDLQYDLPSQPLSYDNLEQMILLAEKQKKSKPKKGGVSSGIVLPPLTVNRPSDNMKTLDFNSIPSTPDGSSSTSPKAEASKPTPPKPAPAKKPTPTKSKSKQKVKLAPTPDMPYEEPKAKSTLEMPADDLVMSRISELMKQKQEREALEKAAQEENKKSKRKKKKRGGDEEVTSGSDGDATSEGSDGGA